VGVATTTTIPMGNQTDIDVSIYTALVLVLFSIKSILLL
jgi:hypothetical protein